MKQGKRVNATSDTYYKYVFDNFDILGEWIWTQIVFNDNQFTLICPLTYDIWDL